MKENFADKVNENFKYNLDYIDTAFQLDLFSGVGSIENESSSFKDVINYFGMPNADETDDRGNRILKYANTGLVFKFINILDESNDPKVSFIRIRKPYKSKNTVYPGLKKNKVHEYMQNLTMEETNNYTEVWSNNDSKHVKFIYDKRMRLESILIY